MTPVRTPADSVLQLRAAVRNDALRLAQIHATDPDGAWTEKDIASWIAHPYCRTAVATYGTPEDIAGFALVLEAGDDAEILAIAVDPPYRSQGVGTMLLNWLDPLCASMSLQRWVLEVAQDNMPAQRLYGKLGFIVVACRSKYYHRASGAVDAYVMSAPVGHLSRS